MLLRNRILLPIAAIGVAAVAIPVIHHYQLKAAVNRYKAELKAKGEPMELAQVIPPPVSPEQNCLPLFTNAFSHLNTNQSVLSSNQPPAMWMVAPGKAMIGWQQPSVREPFKYGATVSWEEIDAALVEEKAGLDMLCQLPNKPVFDFQHNYRDGFGKIQLRQLAPGKKAAQRLSASAASSLHRNDPESAAKDIHAIHSIVHGFVHDQMLISELVRIAIASYATSASWELLQSTNVTDGQLAALQQGWMDLEFIQPFEYAMEMERAVGNIDVKNLRGSNLESYFEPLTKLGLIDVEEGFLARLKIKYKSTMWHYWWSYPDELRYLQGIQAVMDAAHQARTNHSFFAADIKLKNHIEAFGIKPDEGGDIWFVDPAKADFHLIISSSIFAFEKAFNKVMKVEVARQMAITAIALKRFQMKHGQFPENLSELTPGFLPSVRPDPVDGQPLRYRHNADGTFLLYSVGENGVDDGGNPALEKNVTSSNYSWQSPHALDWVWPQPASPAEIQKYFEEQAKRKD